MQRLSTDDAVSASVFSFGSASICNSEDLCNFADKLQSRARINRPFFIEFRMIYEDHCFGARFFNAHFVSTMKQNVRAVDIGQMN